MKAETRPQNLEVLKESLLQSGPMPVMMNVVSPHIAECAPFPNAMDSKQTRIVFGITLLVVLVWLVSPLLGRREHAPDIAANIQSKFDAARAIETTREYVTRFPRRVIGSIEARQSTGFLERRFKDLGYETSYAHFDATIAGRRQVGRNVYAFRQGGTPEILAVAAHYDTAGTTVQGAMDDGSGVGVLLELARLAAAVPTHRSLLFIASDGEEWGMLGIRDLVSNYPERDRIVAALSLDYVAIGDLAHIVLDTIGQEDGYSPPWLRVLAQRAAETEGIPVLEPGGFQEHIERALLFSGTDQGPLLKVGIPAINLSSNSRESAKEIRVYHSAQDTIENLRVESFGIYGRTAERILFSLDGLPSIPRESMGSLRALDDLYLPAPLMLLLHLLAFVPLVAMLYFHSANHHRFISPGRVQREAASFLGTLLPILLPLPIIRALTFLLLLPRYSLYPATPKDPVLEHPSWGVLLGITTTVLVIAVGCYFLIRFLNRNLPRHDFHVSKTVLLGVLLIVIILALVHNAYWAVSFLVLPALIWGLLGPGKGPGERAANRILILAAGIMYIMVSCSWASRLGLGWKMIWYELLAMSTGMFGTKGYVLAASAFALGIRFLVIQSHNGGSRPGDTGGAASQEPAGIAGSV